MEKRKINVNSDLCVGCGLCSDVCAVRNIEIRNKKAEIISDSCVMCGHCTAVCPKKALSISGYSDVQIEKTAEVRLNPQEVLDVIRFRRSVRRFRSQAISRDTIEQILEAGRLTHTAKNMQDVSFIVLKEEKDRVEKMAVGFFKKLKPFANMFSAMARRNKIGDDFFFFGAPVAIAILAKDRTNGLLAAQNMEFVAEANELGVLFSGFFSMAANASFKIKKALKIPKGKKVAATLVLGYPDVKFLRSVNRADLDVRYM